MQRELNLVRQFHRRIGATITDKPKLLDCDPDVAGKLAARLHELAQDCREHGRHELFQRLSLDLEELAEWTEAHQKQDLVAAADGWADRMYVLLGDAVAAGLPGPVLFDEVHRSNMTKGTADAAGKGQKVAGFDRPRIEKIINQSLHEGG